MFDYKKIENEEKSWGIREISKQSVDNIQLYSMVLSYLYQNGFKNTLICFENSAQLTYNKIHLKKKEIFQEKSPPKPENPETQMSESKSPGRRSISNNKSDLPELEKNKKMKTSLFNRMSRGLKSIFGGHPTTKNPNHPKYETDYIDTETNFLNRDRDGDPHLMRYYSTEVSPSHDHSDQPNPYGFLPLSDSTGFDQRSAIRKAIMEKNCDQAEEVLLNFYTNFLRTPQGEEVIIRLRVQKFLDLVKTDPIRAIGFAREKLSVIKDTNVSLMSGNGKPECVMVKD